MALNLSTLTNSATSASILNEALTTADLLDPVPILKNLARGSNKGGDAKQTTGLNQPRALPLIKNPSGNLGGYLYIPNVSGNYATGPSVTIGANETWEGELDMVVTQWGAHMTPMGGGFWSNGFGLVFYTSGAVRLFSKASGAATVSSGVTLGTPFNVKYGFDGSAIYVDIDGTRVYSDSSSGIVSLQSGSITHTLELNQQANIGNVGNYAIQKAKLTVNNAVVFDCDFNGSTSIRHGDTKFQASVGGPVSLIKVGNDPITVVKKSVLRFSTATSGLKGLFANQTNGGYMFAAFSVLGTGGPAGETNGRIFSVNKTGDVDYGNGGAVFSFRMGTTNTLRSYNEVQIITHDGLYDDTNGDILHQIKITQGSQLSKINNADLGTTTLTQPVEFDEFNIGQNEDGIRSYGQNAAIDLEFLALFSADSVPDEATATKIRDYINKRNNVFSLVDNSYYFFDPQKATFTGNFTGSNTLDGYITGSDLGDTDVRTNLTLEQSTLNDQPSTDGYKITFNDSAEHLEFENAASQNLSGWQICGTSLGTFVYRVQGAVTELNLLGNLGQTVYRKAGDLYGVILLPESATGADIEAARSLLIDRGAADGTTSGSIFTYWYNRDDIVEFKYINTSSVTLSNYAWYSCQALEKFPALDLSNSTTLNNAWFGCTALSDFGAIQADSCADFTSAFNGCSALTSFPAGAKLGTSANNVNFTDAWRGSGLTSFNTPLPTATNLSNAFLGCSSLESFSTPLPKAEAMGYSWYNCSSLTDFSSDVFTNWNPSSIGSHVFNLTWDGCTSLTAQSVENILTSIDASNQHGTDDGTSTGNPLGDSGIDIDYNVATGSLSAATNAAIDSLSGKGWEVYINGVLVIPNILDLAPAAAYSLRSFDSNANPNVVNVRRSSDSATRDFKASEVSDGTLTSWVGAGNDGHVTTWYDQGGTNHATQATASSQPKIVDGGTLVTEGGLAALDFDGTDDHLNFASSITTKALFCVTSPVQSINDELILSNGAGGGTGKHFGFNDGVYLREYPDYSPGYTHGLSSNEQSLVSATILSGNKDYYVNSSTVGASSGTALPSYNTIGIPSGLQNFEGNAQEIVIYDSDQSANRTGIENNIMDTYSIS